MFSATFSADIRNLAAQLLKNPIEISVSPENTTATSIKEWIVPVDKKLKPDLLVKLISLYGWTQVLVFTKTKKGADTLACFLDTKGLKAAAIHGDKNQASRIKALSDFKNGITAILIATDVAARGLDIEKLQQVVNFDLPTIAENYIHRIGRTGRAGLSGQAVSLVSADEFIELHEIEVLIKRVLPRKIIDGFEPNHNVPDSGLIIKPKKLSSSKKILGPKKNKGLDLQPRIPQSFSNRP
jgi:ATP-dependent RNA helicase RhlE